jgi:hypothetical protein
MSKRGQMPSGHTINRLLFVGTTRRFVKSYVTINKGKLGSISLPLNPHAHVGSMRIKATRQHPIGAIHHRIFPLAMVTLLAVALGFDPAARNQDVSTASGVQGQVKSVGNNSTREGNRWKQSDC